MQIKLTAGAYSCAYFASTAMSTDSSTRCYVPAQPYCRIASHTTAEPTEYFDCADHHHTDYTYSMLRYNSVSQERLACQRSPATPLARLCRKWRPICNSLLKAMQTLLLHGCTIASDLLPQAFTAQRVHGHTRWEASRPASCNHSRLDTYLASVQCRSLSPAD